ncbi:MAG TPA: hypothetical protein VKV20_11830 [Ktedonobacteraceae bacterium]|nr:hypothetical protein [Ktedonobacteraceae bacterium]
MHDQLVLVSSSRLFSKAVIALPLAEQMRQYGTDPALGQSLIQGLSDTFCYSVPGFAGI